MPHEKSDALSVAIGELRCAYPADGGRCSGRAMLAVLVGFGCLVASLDEALLDQLRAFTPDDDLAADAAAVLDDVRALSTVAA